MAPLPVHDPYGYDDELPEKTAGPRVSNQIPPPSYDNPPAPTKAAPLSKAEQMMKKMGWKEGQGNPSNHRCNLQLYF